MEMEPVKFEHGELCSLSNQYASGIKALNIRYSELGKSECIQDKKDKEVISSMRSDMIKTKKEVDDHISVVYLRRLAKLDEVYERTLVVTFIDLLHDEKLKSQDLMAYVKLSITEINILKLYFEGNDFESIDVLLNWSRGASLRYYISAMYLLKKFFIKDFYKFYSKAIVDLSDEEKAKLKKLKNFRDKIVLKETFKPRIIKLSSNDKLRVAMSEEEFLTLYRVANGEKYIEIDKDYGWPSGYAYRYHGRACKKLNGHMVAELSSSDDKSRNEKFLSENEMKIHRLIEQGKKGKEIARTLGITVEAVKSTRKRIKKKLNA